MSLWLLSSSFNFYYNPSPIFLSLKVELGFVVSLRSSKKKSGNQILQHLLMCRENTIFLDTSQFWAPMGHSFNTWVLLWSNKHLFIQENIWWPLDLVIKAYKWPKSRKKVTMTIFPPAEGGADGSELCVCACMRALINPSPKRCEITLPAPEARVRMTQVFAEKKLRAGVKLRELRASADRRSPRRLFHPSVLFPNIFMTCKVGREGWRAFSFAAFSSGRRYS